MEMDAWIDAWIDVWIDGCMDRCIITAATEQQQTSSLSSLRYLGRRLLHRYSKACSMLRSSKDGEELIEAAATVVPLTLLLLLLLLLSKESLTSGAIHPWYRRPSRYSAHPSRWDSLLPHISTWMCSGKSWWSPSGFHTIEQEERQSGHSTPPSLSMCMPATVGML